MYSVSPKKSPLPATCGFLTFFHKRLRILNQFFYMPNMYIPIYARLRIFIQLSPTLTKLCHIKRDYLVHIICSKCPPSDKTHACRLQMFAKVVHSFVDRYLWQVIPDLLLL